MPETRLNAVVPKVVTVADVADDDPIDRLMAQVVLRPAQVAAPTPTPRGMTLGQFAAQAACPPPSIPMRRICVNSGLPPESCPLGGPHNIALVPDAGGALF